jgi:hypothetical protein
MADYGDKEPVYDAEIVPLMTQIIDICKANGINMVASFQLRNETDEEGHALCTTLLPLNKDCFPDDFRNFGKALYTRPTVIAMTITTGGEVNG